MIELSAGQAAMAAGVGATVTNLVLSRLIIRQLNAPKTFAPLTPLPLILGSIIGAVGATAVYGILARLVAHPRPLIYGMAGIVLIVSVLMPLRLLRKRPRRTNRFDGATPALVAGLFVLHSVVAVWSLYALRFWLP